MSKAIDALRQDFSKVTEKAIKELQEVQSSIFDGVQWKKKAELWDRLKLELESKAHGRWSVHYESVVRDEGAKKILDLMNDMELFNEQ